MVAAHTVRMRIARRLSIDNSEGLFVRVPTPDPPAAPAGALPNTLEVERLHTVACEKVKQQLCLREGGASGAKKPAPPAPAPAPTFFKEPEPSQTGPE